MFNRPELPDSFQGRLFKGNIWGEGCSSWTFFRLVGAEVTGWCFGNLNHQSLVPTSLGSTCWLSSYSHHLGRGPSFCRTTQIYALDYYVYPLGRN